MDELIFDAYSIFFQILQHFAPDYVGDYSFLLTGYAFASAFTLLVMWQLLRLLGSFANAVLSWYYKKGV